MQPKLHSHNNIRPWGSRITLLVVMFSVPLALVFVNPVLCQAQEPRLLSVLNPTGFPPPIERKPMAARPDSLEGKTIYLVDVTFNNGDVFLQEMQKWFAQNSPGVKTVFRVKKGAYYTDDPELWQEIQDVNGLMIMAIGH